MIIKSILILSVLISAACTSNDEAAPTPAEPVAPEVTAEPATPEATEPPADAAPAPTPEETTEAPPATPPSAPAESGDFYIAVSHLNVRSGPGMANGAVEVLTFNTPVQSQGVENRIWVKIGEGRYVSKNYLSEQKMSQPKQVQAASQQQQQPAATAAPAQPVAAPAAVEAPAQTEVAPPAEQPATEQPTEPAPAEADKELPVVEGSEG